MATGRRTTIGLKIFDRPGPEAVTYDLSKGDCVTITVPVGSKWTSGPHWHETHTEFLQVLQGRAFIRLGLRAGVYGPEDGVIEVPKYTVHEWHRTEGKHDQDFLVVREWTVPSDGQKEMFFRMLNSCLTEAHPQLKYTTPAMTPRWMWSWIESWIVPLQLFCIFRSRDNWPVFVGDDSGWYSWCITHSVLGSASAIGYVFGLQGEYKEYIDAGHNKGFSTRAETRKLR